VDRLEIGGLQLDQVKPVIALDLDIVRRVTDHSVVGLLGQGVVVNRVLWIDHRGERLIILPSEPGRDAPNGEPTSDGPRSRGGAVRDATPAVAVATIEGSRRDLVGVIWRNAVPVAFRMAGNGKALLTVWVTPAPGNEGRVPLTLALDTGATKSVLFESALAGVVPSWREWRSLDGLVAPTLLGPSRARIALVPGIELRSSGNGQGPIRSRRAARRDVDCAVTCSARLPHCSSVEAAGFT